MGDIVETRPDRAVDALVRGFLEGLETQPVVQVLPAIKVLPAIELQPKVDARTPARAGRPVEIPAAATADRYTNGMIFRLWRDSQIN